MVTFFKIVHLSAATLLILVVLLQSGRGGGIGSALSGATGQIFGGRGANTFLTRVTTGLAVVFFSTSLTLSMLSSRHHSVVPRQPAANPTSAQDALPEAETQDHVDAPTPTEKNEAKSPKEDAAVD